MSRRIITKKLDTTGTQVDTYFDRVIKYIPAEIIAAWTAAIGLVNSDPEAPKNTLLWGLFVIFLLLTAAWTLKQTTEKNKPPALTQTAISTGSFAVWVFALGDPFVTLAFYRPWYGSLALILYTLVVALINPPEEQELT
ncbi:MAG: hypothetical protein AB4426_06060 [Xenococcaceae cyanobacterium]